MKTVKIGVMPGRIQEVAVEVGATVASVIEIAGLSVESGFEVKVDGNTVDPTTATVSNTTGLILLAKKVKGNTDATKQVKVGIMPGRINEFGVVIGATIQSVIELAELNASGYEVKVDGQTIDPTTTKVTATTGLILLAKKVKGNADTKLVKIGVMPGRINEFGVEVGATIASVIVTAELNSTGFEVKVDGQTVDPDNTVVTASTGLILLAKKVKGNN